MFESDYPTTDPGGGDSPTASALPDLVSECRTIVRRLEHLVDEATPASDTPPDSDRWLLHADLQALELAGRELVGRLEAMAAASAPTRADKGETSPGDCTNPAGHRFSVAGHAYVRPDGALAIDGVPTCLFCGSRGGA
jgi:hypothetical protein